MRAAVLCVLLLGVVGATAQLSATFSAADAKSAAALATSHLSSVTGRSLSPSDAYWSSVVLKHAGVEGSKPTEACQALRAAIEALPPVADLSYALRAAHSLGCLKKKHVTDAVVAAVHAGLASPVVSDVYAAAAALDTLAAKGADPPSDLEGVAAAVADLLERNGLFRESADGAATATAAGMAYHVLATAWPSVKDPKVVRAVQAAARTVGTLLQGASGPEEGPLELGDGEDKLLTTALAVSGALRLAAATGDDVDIQADQLAAFGAFFLQHRHVRDAATLGQMLTGLQAVATNSVVVPLAVTLQSSALAHGTAAPLVVEVTNVFGRFATAATVTLFAATRVGDANALVADVELEPVSGDAEATAYKLDIMAAHPAPGVYELQLGVVPASALHGEVDSIERMVQISTSLKLTSAHIQVAGGPAGSATATAEYPGAASNVLAATTASHVNIVFDVVSEAGEPLRPHQAFVRLVHQDTGVSTVFVAAAEHNSLNGAHRVSLNIGDRESLHEAGVAGTYDVDLLIGDTTIHNPSVWRIGAVKLTPASPPAKAEETLYTKPLLHESDTTLSPLPEIEHVFRTPDSRPPSIVSRGFTALTLLPLGLLLIGLLTTGANTDRLTSIGTTGFLWAVVFMASLAAILLLIFTYWLRLNMFQFLQYLIAPAALAGVSGVQLFRAIGADMARQKAHAD